VIAITGSAGKTTTKDLCAALWRSRRPCHATVGNLNNRIGVPAVAFGVESQHACVVFEIGMNSRGEIADLAAIIEPHQAVITNIGVAHAEGVGGTRADVAHEKGAAFEALAQDGVAIFNADDAAVIGQLARTRARHRVAFGRAEAANVRLIERVPLGARGSRVTIELPRGAKRTRVDVDLPIVGEASAIDFVAALATTASESFETTEIRDALASLTLSPGRASVRRLNDGTLIFDDTYNANPASMRASLAAAAELASSDGRRLVCVLGEMRELGPAANDAHDALGVDVANAHVALAIGCGGLVDRALDVAARTGIKTVKASSTEEAAAKAALMVEANDVVLVKGSRGVATEKVVDALERARGKANE
jgi:UDP-N-acetylmuramoyl-tripeptide--D-alanyl-D-alanine ligase